MSFLSYAWPKPLGDAAYHGLAGEIVYAIEPSTAADPAGVLLHTLVMFGNAVGRGPHYEVEATQHHTNEFVLFIGQTATGRKGTAFNQALQLFRLSASQWCENRIQSGLSSGEGLIAAVRDPVAGEGDRPGVAGVDDKRLLVKEAEFACTLRVARREGNNLSGIIRECFDTGTLGTMTKHNRTTATAAHISIVGHTTPDELRRYADRTDIASGFMNRFLIACVKRSKALPDGGSPRGETMTTLARQLLATLVKAEGIGRMQRSDAGRELWFAEYPRLSEPSYTGLLAALTGRGVAHVLRLSCIYALMDGSNLIEVPHLEAALEVWRYAQDSAAFVFGDILGDPIADALLRALRQSQDGLTRTEIRDFFGRNRSREEIDSALRFLVAHGLAEMELEDTGGRPRERWRAL